MDDSVRRNEQKGVLIADVHYSLSPTPLPFSLPPEPIPFSTPAKQAIQMMTTKTLER